MSQPKYNVGDIVRIVDCSSKLRYPEFHVNRVRHVEKVYKRYKNRWGYQLEGSRLKWPEEWLEKLADRNKFNVGDTVQIVQSIIDDIDFKKQIGTIAKIKYVSDPILFGNTGDYRWSYCLKDVYPNWFEEELALVQTREDIEALL